ncbi:hypothetical protein ACFPRL_00890 [Pseudoclavibacter helvolus]
MEQEDGHRQLSEPIRDLELPKRYGCRETEKRAGELAADEPDAEPGHEAGELHSCALVAQDRSPAQSGRLEKDADDELTVPRVEGRLQNGPATH